MSGPVSIHAIAEMNRRAEEYSLKVRSELFRIGCPPQQISVIRQGPYLQMKHQQQIIIAPPQGLLSVLQRIPAGAECTTVWGRICQHARLLDKQAKASRSWIAATLSLLALLVFLVIFLKL